MKTKTKTKTSYFLLTYELCGIRFNIVVVAHDWSEAKSKAPKAAKNVNAAWLP